MPDVGLVDDVGCRRVHLDRERVLTKKLVFHSLQHVPSDAVPAIAPADAETSDRPDPRSCLNDLRFVLVAPVHV
jgi:hypothetical protein